MSIPKEIPWREHVRLAQGAARAADDPAKLLAALDVLDEWQGQAIGDELDEAAEAFALAMEAIRLRLRALGLDEPDWLANRRQDVQRIR